MKRIVSSLLLLLIICALCTTALAAPPYVADEGNVLTSGQVRALEERARQLSETYHFGVYIVTVNTTYGKDCYDYATERFLAEGMGVGSMQQGVLLVLNVVERDYALAVHGDDDEYIFTDYGQDTMVDAFLDRFGSNDWAGGFGVYLDYCEKILSMAAAGTPFDSRGTSREKSSGFTVVPMVIGLIAALIVTGIMRSGMKSVKLQTRASGYQDKSGLKLQIKTDTFTHHTVTRRPIPQNTSGSRSSGHSGGTHHSGGGFHGRSGKF